MLQEYKYYTECMRAIIWTNDARIIVKRPRMLSTQSVALYKTCKPKPRLSTQICVHNQKDYQDNKTWKFLENENFESS